MNYLKNYLRNNKETKILTKILKIVKKISNFKSTYWYEKIKNVKYVGKH